MADALARYYDLDLEADPGDVEMYLALAKAAKGPLLELMAGSGRVAVPLARNGHRVVAVDRDDAMLARADAYWQRVRRRASKSGELVLLQHDVTKLKLNERFGLVIVALNSLLLLNGRGAIAAAVKTMAKHLAPGGRAVIDVWLPSAEDLTLYDGRLLLDWVREDDESNETVAKQTSAAYDSTSRTARLTTFFDAWRDGDAVTRNWREDVVTFVSIGELESYARDAGLSVNTIAGDYEMGHFAAGSERVVMVFGATKR